MQRIEEDRSVAQVQDDDFRWGLAVIHALRRIGATAGYLDSKAHVAEGSFSFFDVSSGLNQGGGPFNGTVQVPFVGVYAAATRAGFFVDGLLRAESYQTNLNAPLSNLFSQNVD